MAYKPKAQEIDVTSENEWPSCTLCGSMMVDHRCLSCGNGGGYRPASSLTSPVYYDRTMGAVHAADMIISNEPLNWKFNQGVVNSDQIALNQSGVFVRQASHAYNPADNFTQTRTSNSISYSPASFGR